MKKNIGILAMVLVAFISGYFIGDSTAINRINKQISTNVTNQQNNKLDKARKDADTVVKEEKQNEIPIIPSDIMPEITILEPNSIGTVYMEATYINNSDYPITSYSAKILLKDKNDTTYLSTHNTVMPGETSPIFDCFGPSTMDPDDYEILNLEVRARLDNGKVLTIEYDFKLNEAKWSEYEN